MDWKIVLHFIVEYWRELLTALVCLLTVLINLLKKRPTLNKIAEIKEDVLEFLPKLILKVEVDGNGQRKKNAVIELIKKYVQKKYKFDLTPDLIAFVDENLESVLATPQKKEGH